MSISIIGRRYGTNLTESRGTDGSVSGNVVVEYLLRSTDCAADEADLREVDGLPSLGEANDVFPDMFAIRRSFQEGDGDGLYVVSIEFSSELPDGDDGSGGGGGAGSTPWDAPVKVSYSTRRKPSLKTKMIFLGAFNFEVPTPLAPTAFSWQADSDPMLDENGNRVITVTNSAGSPIYYDGERILRVVELSFASTVLGIASWLDRVNSVNTNEVYISDLYPSVKPGAALLDEFTADRKIHTYSNGFREVYYDCRASIVLDPLGHWVEFADIGSVYFEGGLRLAEQSMDDSIAFLNKDHAPTTAQLNGRGGAKAAYEDTYFLKYVPYSAKAW